MRTPEEIKRQVDGLLKMKEWLPEYSGFGEPNWAIIDAQVSILEGAKLSDFDEGDWEEMDETNKIFREAERVPEWLDGMNEDLFEERN